MAEKVKGITIQIGGDTSGLNKALSSTNKEIKSTQSELKAVERMLKLDPGNTDLIRQKQELLNKAIGETKQKGDALKAAKVQADKDMANGTQVNQEEYRKLCREIVANESAQKDLEAQASRTNITMEKIGATAEKVGAGANKVASATKALSATAAAGAAGLVAMAYKAGAAADDLNTISNQSGFSTSEIQKWKYASDTIDVSVDDIVGAAKKMKKNMTSTSKETTEAWSRIGVAVRDSNGELRDSSTVFNEALKSLSGISNETERDTLAMQLFGKSADSLAGIVDDGGEALNQMGKEAEASGLILSQDALDGANAFNDGIDILKAKASAAFMSAGASLAENLLPFLDELVDKISGVLQWVASLDGGTIKAIGTVLLAVAAISPVAKIIGGISTAIGGVSKILTPLITHLPAIGKAISTVASVSFKAVSTAASAIASGVSTAFGFITNTVLPAIGNAFQSTFAFIAANPIVLVITAIVALVALIAAKGDEIQKILKSVDDFMQGIFVKDWSESLGVMGNLLNGFFATVKGIWDAIVSVFDGVIDIIRGVFTGDWSRAWNGVKEIFAGIFGGLAAIAKAPINAIIGLLNGAIDAINWIIGGLNKIHVDIPDWVPLVGGKSFGINIGQIGKIPYLAKGGVLSQGSAVVGEAGPELLTMLGSRAMVQPLTNQNSTTNYGGTTINVYGAPGQNVQELADIVADEINCRVVRRGATFA